MTDAKTETVYVAVSSRGHLAPFLGMTYRRKDLFKARLMRGIDPKAAGYRAVKARITFAKVGRDE
jgi:hypothetical protein